MEEILSGHFCAGAVLIVAVISLVDIIEFKCGVSDQTRNAELLQRVNHKLTVTTNCIKFTGKPHAHTAPVL